MGTRGGVYTRMSKAAGEHKIEAQEAMGRKLVSANGIEITAAYVDDGVSAFTGMARRGWQQMFEDAARGSVAILLAQSEDRFARHVAEKELLAMGARTPAWLG